MAELVNLAIPVPGPARTNYKIKRINLEPIDELIYIELLGNDGHIIAHSYTGEEAKNLMILLNKANLSTNSLEKRIFTKLIADGVIAGSITGNPD